MSAQTFWLKLIPATIRPGVVVPAEPVAGEVLPEGQADDRPVLPGAADQLGVLTQLGHDRAVRRRDPGGSSRRPHDLVLAQDGSARSKRRSVGLGVHDAVARLVAQVASDLAQAGIAVEDLGLRQPTLDDVFLTLTGVPVADADDVAEEAAA